MIKPEIDSQVPLGKEVREIRVWVKNLVYKSYPHRCHPVRHLPTNRAHRFRNRHAFPKWDTHNRDTIFLSYWMESAHPSGQDESHMSRRTLVAFGDHLPLPENSHQ